MVGGSDRFRVHEQEVAAKVIDGEAIIINLTTGVYYSLDPTGSEVWSLLEARHDVDAIVGYVCGRFDVPERACRSDVEQLVEQLLEEKLIVPANGDAPGPPPDGGPSGRAYSPPRLDIYRDMGDLLALDPPVPGLEPIPWDDPLEESRGPSR
jgi:hypothetical protein